MKKLSISAGALDLILDEIRVHGRAGLETGGFLLGSALHDEVQIVALAGERGVRRRRDYFGISGAAIEVLFAAASDAELQVVAQFHSHRRKAFLSETDLRYGFSVDGFATSIIPTYSDPPDDPNDWGWWVYGKGEWRVQPGFCSVRPGPVAAWLFDEEGLR